MIGLMPSEFWDLLPRQFFLMQKAYHKKVEQKTIESWEQTRWLAAVMMQPHMKKGARIKPTDIAKFPWEKNTNKTKQTRKEVEEEIEYTLQLYQKIHGSKKKD